VGGRGIIVWGGGEKRETVAQERIAVRCGSRSHKGSDNGGDDGKFSGSYKTGIRFRSARRTRPRLRGLKKDGLLPKRDHMLGEGGKLGDAPTSENMRKSHSSTIQTPKSQMAEQKGGSGKGRDPVWRTKKQVLRIILQRKKITDVMRGGLALHWVPNQG